MKNSFTLFLALLCFIFTNAQRVAINTDGSSPAASAILDVKSSNRGVLLPRMTLANRNLIGSPAAGLLIYQTDAPSGYYYYNGINWLQVGDNLGNHTLTQNLNTDGLYLSKSGASEGIRLLANGAVSIRTKNVVGLPFDGESFRFDTVGNILAIGKVMDVGNTTGAANKIPATGAGTRFLWFAPRGSLRFGRATGTEWDDANMDDFTFAGGNHVQASGYGAFAFGDGVNVSSTVGVGFGSAIDVTGTAGFGVGASHIVSGFCATALGYSNKAYGQGSVAIGYRCSASADYSIALGYRASSNFHTGCMTMGDQSTTDSLRNTLDNQFMARYAGGYRLYTNPSSNGVGTIGVFLSANGNAWGSISDSTKKERYQPADKEYFLQKLAQLKLGSWNYKGFRGDRHYGPMAQEIFAAYGRDAYGNIGCDTVLTTADMDGIAMILLQGLEQRSTVQKQEMAAMKQNLDAANEQMATLRRDNETLRAELASVKKLEQQLMAMQEKLLQIGQSTTVAANSTEKPK